MANLPPTRSMRILLVSPFRPDDRSFGGGQRTALLHAALSEIAEVSTLVLREGDALASRTFPEGIALAEVTYPRRKAGQKYRPVRELQSALAPIVDLAAFDVVVGRYLGPLLALPPFPGRAVVDADDAYYRYSASRTPVLGAAIAALKSRARLSVGRRALRRVDHTWFCCERDRLAFPSVASSVLPNVVQGPDVVTRIAGNAEPVVLMVGALWYQPNRDAVEWFLRACWPAIHEKLPAARFRVIGAASPELRATWAGAPGVECPGFVDDIAAEYRRASVTVVPVTAGGGTQIKVLESLAHGRAPVVSSFVANGFSPHLRAGESLYVADTPAAMIERVTRILAEPEASQEVADAGRQVVLTSFSEQNFRKVVASTIT